MARLILTTPGEDVHVGGSVDVVGTTSGGEVITILEGAITLDASFNAGGDTLVMPGNSAAYTVQLSGSRALLVSSGGVSVSIPLGITGTTIQFADGTVSLQIDAATGAAMLGEQTITTAAQPVEIVPTQSVYGTNLYFEEEPNHLINNEVDRSLLTSSPGDPNLTHPDDPSVILRGVIEDDNDLDFFMIYLDAGETITLDVDGAYNPEDVSGLDSVVAILDAVDVLAENDDGGTLDAGSASELDSYLTFQAPVSGYYYIAIFSDDDETPGGSPERYHLLVSIDDEDAANQQAMFGANNFSAMDTDDKLYLDTVAFA